MLSPIGPDLFHPFPLLLPLTSDTLQGLNVVDEDATLTIVITVIGVLFLALIIMSVIYCMTKKFVLLTSNHAFFAKHSRSRWVSPF